MSDEIRFTPEPSNHCPSCGASFTPETVLCVACGYHLKFGRRLDTVVVQHREAAPDPNPYASPADVESGRPSSSREPPVFDLTEAGVRQATAVVSDAQSVFLVILLAWCVCAPAWLVMLPWYAYRLYSWHRLNKRFAELRNPNSFSTNGELAGKFQDARGRLLFGVIAGSTFWAIAVLWLLFRLLRH